MQGTGIGHKKNEVYFAALAWFSSGTVKKPAIFTSLLSKGIHHLVWNTLTSGRSSRWRRGLE